MTIEIDIENRNEVLKRAKAALEWQEFQRDTIKNLECPIHTLYGVSEIYDSKISELKSLIRALGSPHRVYLSMEEALALNLI